MQKQRIELSDKQKSLIKAAIIVFALIVFSYCLTLFVAPGSYERVEDGYGKSAVVPGSYTQTAQPGQYPVYNILFSIIKAFAPAGSPNITMISIMLFILLIGGAFTLLDKSGILRAVIAKIAAKMYHKKYLLIAVISFVFMFFRLFFSAYLRRSFRLCRWLSALLSCWVGTADGAWDKPSVCGLWICSCAL